MHMRMHMHVRPSLPAWLPALPPAQLFMGRLDRCNMGAFPNGTLLVYQAQVGGGGRPVLRSGSSWRLVCTDC